MLAFHITIHARSAAILPGPLVNLRGRATLTWQVTGEALSQPFDVTFEQAAAALESLERMFVEPDGSFVWVCAKEPRVASAEIMDRNTLKQSPGLNVPLASGFAGGPTLDPMSDTAGSARVEARFIADSVDSYSSEAKKDQPAWQLDGNLYDRDDRLLLVDLKGSCPLAALDQLLACFGWPATAVVFQITQAAVFVDEPTFRAWAETNDES